MHFLSRVALAVTRTAYLITVCRNIGHDRSWVDGLAAGFNRPVCRRCRARL